MNELRTQGLEVSHGARRRSRPATSTSRPATTSSAATSRSARSPTCTSRFRTTRRRTRRRTTTPAGRSSTCATSRSTPITDKGILDQQMTLLTADAKAPGGIEGTGSVLVVDHTGRQQPRHVPVQEHGREDAGGRGRLRARRPQVPRRRDHRAERRPREARADAEGSRAVGVGGGGGAEREDARPRHPAHRLHPQLDAHAGRGLVARGARHLRRALHLLRRSEAAATATCARSTTSSSSRTSAAARCRRSTACRRPATRRCRTRRRRSSRTSASSTRATTSAAAWASRGWSSSCKFVQDGGTLITEGSTATIFPEYGITTGVTVEEPAQLFVRGSILRAQDHRHEEPDRLRLRQRRPAGLLQPVAGAERGGRRLRRHSAAAAAARRGPTRTAASART